MLRRQPYKFPLSIRCRDVTYVRAISKVLPDASLVMEGAVEEGAVTELSARALKSS